MDDVIRRARWAVALALCAVVALAVGACGTDEEGGEPAAATADGPLKGTPECNKIRPVPAIDVEKPSKSYKIVNLQAHRFDSFANTLAWGAGEEAKRLGAKLTTLDAGGYQFPQKQMAQIQAAMTQKADAILIWATDVNAVAPLVKQAREAGIVVVGYVQLPETELDAHAVSDDEQESYELNKCLIEAAGGKGEYAAVYGVAGSTYQAAIEKGFQRAVGEFPDAKIVSEKLIPDVDPAKTQNIVQDELQRHPNLTGIFGTVLSMANGATQAVAAAGKAGKVGVAATNIDSPKAADLLEQGAYTVVASQAPAVYGKVAVAQAIALLEDVELSEEQRKLTMQANIYTDPNAVRENLDQELAPQFR
jgi:ABC-type sugar transport system substrate-binding protein